MRIETWLTFVMMAGAVIAFVSIHLALRRFPYEQAVPRERFRWPVWNWYALVVGIGILFGLSANLYWNARVPLQNPPSIQEPAWSYESVKPVNEGDAPNVIEPDEEEIRRVRGED